MKIAITFNPRRKDTNCETVIQQFKDLLQKEKIEYYDLTKTCDKPDLIAVFGGDGTILATAKYATDNQVPIIAINVGTVGFLSSFEEKDLQTNRPTGPMMPRKTVREIGRNDPCPCGSGKKYKNCCGNKE